MEFNHGYDELGVYNGDGLSQRMKALFGVDWDLTQEILRHSLIAGGADDKTRNPLLQNPRRVRQTYGRG